MSIAPATTLRMRQCKGPRPAFRSRALCDSLAEFLSPKAGGRALEWLIGELVTLAGPAYFFLQISRGPLSRALAHSGAGTPDIDGSPRGSRGLRPGCWLEHVAYIADPGGAGGLSLPSGPDGSESQPDLTGVPLEMGRPVPLSPWYVAYCNLVQSALCLRIDFGQTKGPLRLGIAGARSDCLPNIDEPSQWSRPGVALAHDNRT